MNVTHIKWNTKQSLKRKETTYTATWINPEDMILNKKKLDTKGQILYIFTLCVVPRIVKFTETERRMVVIRDSMEGGMGSYFLMGAELFEKMKKDWGMDGDGCIMLTY